MVSQWFRIVENRYTLKLRGQLAPPAQAEGWPTTWPRLAHGLRWSGVRTALISKLFLNASRAGPPTYKEDVKFFLRSLDMGARGA